MELSYGEYLKLDQVLGAQQPLSQGEHDEMLFIIIHQTYELWFKQMLHEGGELTRLLGKGEDFKALAVLQRMLVILKTMVKQTDILETMTPLSFASFRSKLQQSSGFQSVQFRQFEFFLGHKNAARLKVYPPESRAFALLQESLHAPSLYDCFLRYLHMHTPYALPTEIIQRDFSLARELSDQRVEAVLLQIYRQDPKLRLICEKLVDLDEGMQEWRYRHVKMVERTIGNKMGTGGSSGVDYLKRSLFCPAFPELWQVRQAF